MHSATLWKMIDVVGALILISSTALPAAQKTATWSGGGDGVSYNDSANWDIGEVPINNTTDTYIVVIGPSVTVDYNAAPVGVGNNTVDQFTLAAGSTFNIKSGRLLEVVADTAVGGTVNVENAGLLNAPALTGALTGNTARILLQGANPTIVTLGAGSYDSTGIDTGTLLSADGAQTTLNLANLATLTDASNYVFARVRTIEAKNGATLNLAALHTLNGATGDDTTRLLESAGGSITLTNLTTLTGNVRVETDAALFTLPSLQTAQNLSFVVNPGIQIDLPQLTQQTGGTYNLPPVATANLPLLTQLTAARVTIANNSAAFNVPLLANIDDTFFNLSGAANLALPLITAYTGNGFSSGTFLSADGAGTVLDLSAMTTLTSTANHVFANTRTIAATSGGQVNLSALNTLNGPSGDDTLQVSQTGGGLVLLPHLTTTTGRVRFTTDTDLQLAQLQNANSLFFDMPPGSQLDLPALVSQTGGAYDLPAGATFLLNALTSMTSTSLTISDNLATFSAPVLANIDNSFVHVSGGAQLALPLITAYAGNGFSSGTFLSADGAGTVLDLSNVQSIDSAANYVFANTRTIEALDGASINLSSVNSLKGGSGDDRLRVHVGSSATIDLSNLQSVTAGAVVFDVEAQGTLHLGNFTVTGNTTFNINDATSAVDVAGSLLLDDNAVFHVATGGGIKVGGHFSFATQDESQFTAASGILHMDGAGTFFNPQFLEVGGEDLGLPVDLTDPTVIPGTGDNFALGQLVIGSPGRDTVVELRDAIDNGNRHSLEALYLPGLGGDGLQFFGDSVLNIESINVYTFLDGQWVHLNALFAGQTTSIDFNTLVSDPEATGRIIIPEPATLSLMALAGLVLCRRRRACGA